MKYSMFLLLPSVILFSSCNNTAKQLKEKIAVADSVAINYFKDDGKMDTVITVKIIKNQKEIEQLTAFITAENASERNNCGYNGSIHYFRNDTVVQDIFFSTSVEGCQYFQFSLDRKKGSTILSNEAVKFLFAIKNNHEQQ